MFQLQSKVLIVVLLLRSSYGVCANSYFNWDAYASEKKGLVMAGGATLVIGGVGLYMWATRAPSNEVLYARARDVYEALCDRYGAMELLDRAETLVRCTEQDLTALISHRDMKNMPRVGSDLHSLLKERDRVQACIRRDVQKNDPSTPALCVLVHEMNQLSGKLNHMKLFWEEHACFFELYQDVRNLTQRYKEALGGVYSQILVKRMIMEGHDQPRSEYPYIRFSETLKSDINLLCDRMNTMQSYTTLYNEANMLQQKLSGLQTAIVRSPEYKQECQLSKGCR